MSRQSAGRRERKREAKRRRAEVCAERRRSSSAASATKPNGAEPIIGSEAPTIWPFKEWYIARLAPRSGQKAIDGMERRGVDVVIPRVSEIVTRAGRRMPRSRQLLLRQAFIGVANEAHLDRARAVAGVAEIVSVPRDDPTATGNIEGVVMRPARLDAVALQLFVDALADKEVVEPYGVKEGDAVIVRGGRFASFPAIVEQILPNDVVKVAVSIFGRAAPCEMPIAQVERVT